MGLGDLLVVDLAEPVVGGDRAGVGKDQAAYAVGDGAVLLYAPVVDLEIVVHQLLVVEEGGTDVAHLFALLAIEDICLCDIGVAAFGKHLFRAVLYILDGDLVVLDLGLKIRCDAQGEHIDHGRMALLSQSVKRLLYRRADLADIEICNCAVSFDHLIHLSRSSLYPACYVSPAENA